jgi:hypothetical protein
MMNIEKSWKECIRVKGTTSSVIAASRPKVTFLTRWKHQSGNYNGSLYTKQDSILIKVKYIKISHVKKIDHNTLRDI